MTKIKVCADPFPPYQYVDKDGSIKGKDYELVVSRLRAAGYDPEVCIAAVSYTHLTLPTILLV